MHSLLIFPVLYDTVMVLAFDALETLRAFFLTKVAENVLNLLFSEVISPRLIIPHIEIV